MAAQRGSTESRLWLAIVLGFVMTTAFDGRAQSVKGTPRGQQQGNAAPSVGRERSAQAPRWGTLKQGRPFHGDLRALAGGLPPQRERRPDREELEGPELLPQPTMVDPVLQEIEPVGFALSAGAGSGAASSGGLDFAGWGDGWPPDVNGDVGPSHYIQAVNASVGIFDKATGNRITAFTLDALMGQGQFGNACDDKNMGDPTVVYDSGANRWFIGDFAFALDVNGNPVAPFYQCIAVSRTGDPVNGGWYFYAIETTDRFPDYPKMGIWPDGLYITANMFNNGVFAGVRAWVLNKDQMFAGAAAQQVSFDLPSILVNGAETVYTAIPGTYHTVTGVPPAGRENFLAVIWSAKVARVWKVHVDWSRIANSSLTGPANVTLASWGVAPTTVAAKAGNPLETLRERLMVQARYASIGGTESLWLTHTVANPNATYLPAPRWYQLNVTGGTVVTTGPIQQSTFAPDTTTGRWLSSLAIDKDGNMAIGYSASSSTLYPAIRYAGRMASDALNTLGQSELSLIEGTASQCCTFSSGTTNTRWGDYSMMSIDPDGCTFWYTNQYYESPQPTTNAQNNWKTKIGSFKYDSCTPISGPGTLQGNVTNATTGAAVAGATVSLGGTTRTTDVAGFYQFADITSGKYTMTTTARGYATSTLSNVAVPNGGIGTKNVALTPTAGDLTLTAVSNPPAVLAPGGTMSSTTTVKNAGTVAVSVTSYVKFYLSLDSMKSADDVLFSTSRQVRSVSAGAVSTAAVTLTVPATTPLNTYMLLACADDTNVVVEIDEANNCLAATAPVKVTRPDLLATAVTNPPSLVAPSGTFPVTDTTQNIGDLTAAASTTKYYLSEDRQKGTGDVLLTGYRSVASLVSGGMSTGTVTLTVPTTATRGPHFLLACADDAAVVAETSESNNCFASATTVTVKLGDLRVASVSNPPVEVAAGKTFSITETTTNSGDNTAAASTTRYYFSADGAKDAGDLLLTGTRSVVSLAVNASSTGTVTLTVPATAVMGTFRVLACADDLAVVKEVSETNNCTASSSTVSVPWPDLVTTAVTTSVTSIARGAQMGITDTVKNLAAVAPAAASTTRYYLSLDAVKDAGDIMFTITRAVVSLAPGAVSTGSVTKALVPTTTPLGYYYVIACADDLAKVGETNETNNCLATAATIQVK